VSGGMVGTTWMGPSDLKLICPNSKCGATGHNNFEIIVHNIDFKTHPEYSDFKITDKAPSPLEKCPKCDNYKDTPMHVVGCESPKLICQKCDDHAGYLGGEGEILCHCSCHKHNKPVDINCSNCQGKGWYYYRRTGEDNDKLECLRCKVADQLNDIFEWIEHNGNDSDFVHELKNYVRNISLNCAPSGSLVIRLAKSEAQLKEAMRLLDENNEYCECEGAHEDRCEAIVCAWHEDYDKLLASVGKKA